MEASTFDLMFSWKQKSNRDFERGMNNSALENYMKAEETVGGDGPVMVPDQRAEVVSVLSNQGECFLRMNKHRDAFLKTTSALQMDSSHTKSILRRGRVILSAASDIFYDGVLESILKTYDALLKTATEKGQGRLLNYCFN